jgi:hypothetical protein
MERDGALDGADGAVACLAWPGLASVEYLFRVFYRDLTCPAGSVAFDDLRIVVAVSVVVTHARS